MKKILCFGDSNTWGHNPADGSRLEHRWEAILRGRMTDCEITADGLCGRAARTFTPEMADTDGETAFRERYINSDREYDLIVIMLGTNDVLNDVNSTPEEIADALKDYIDGYRAAHKNYTEFLIISPILLKSALLEHPVFGALYSRVSIEKSTRLADCLLKMSEDSGAHFMDAAVFAEASDADGVHMEPAGHEKLAAAVERKIKKILNIA